METSNIECKVYTFSSEKPYILPAQREHLRALPQETSVILTISNTELKASYAETMPLRIALDRTRDN